MEKSPLPFGISGVCRAPYSVHLYAHEFRLLIDCGDGTTGFLGEKVGSPRTVAITHGHPDHIMGLPAFAGARSFQTLISGGPVQILYPAGCSRMPPVIRMIEELRIASRERVTFREVEAGERIPTSSAGRDIVPFRTVHPGVLSLGYAVVETRKRLLPHLRSTSQREIAALAANGTKVSEVFEAPLLVHTGDTALIDGPLFDNAQVVVYDATFLTAGDRRTETHASAEEVVGMLNGRGIAHLVLHHLSHRYERAEAIRALRSLEFDGRLSLWDGPEFLSLR